MVFEATHPYVTLRLASESAGAYHGKVVWYSLRPEYREQLDIEQLHRAAEARLGLFFGVAGLFDNFFRIIGLHELAAQRRANQLFCSEYVAECFSAAKLDPAQQPSHFTCPEMLTLSPLWQREGVLALQLHHEHQACRDRRDENLKSMGYA